MSQPLVLAIEPDLRQAAIVKRIVREKALADVAVVDSRDAAIEAMRTCMPDVLLVSALLSPRDEDELIAHLKTLENAGHLQTHTIPQLASALQAGEERGGRGLLSAFRRKKDPGPASGCDPDLFADEIRVFLKRAEEKKVQLRDSNHATPDMRPSPAGAARAAVPEQGEATAPQASSWSSPFEWKPAAASSRSAAKSDPRVAVFVAPVTKAGPALSPIVEAPPPIAEPQIAIPEPAHSIAAFAAPVAAVEAAVPEPVAPIVAAVSAVPAPPVPSPDPPAPAREPRKRDSGLKSRDPRSAIRDAGLAALGLAPAGAWMRREAERPETQDGPEDVRALLSTLAVPPAIASVSYPRGCRIRRVRVPAAPDAEAAEAAGAVIASGRAAANHRDRRPAV